MMLKMEVMRMMRMMIMMRSDFSFTCSQFLSLGLTSKCINMLII